MGRDVQIRWLEENLRSCGQGLRVRGEFRISGVECVSLGDNVHLGAGGFIRGEGGLEIGDNTHISRNVVIYTMNHYWRGERLPYDERMVLGPVRIGRNVWIGMNVCIVPGTTIGDGAIVGMGCVVSGEVPALAIIGSPKWRVLGYRDEAHYRELDERGAFGGADGEAVGGSHGGLPVQWEEGGGAGAE